MPTASRNARRTCSGTLPVDFQHDVPSGGHLTLKPDPRCGVKVSVNLCPFEKFARLAQGAETIPRNEVVIRAIALTRARRARREGDGELQGGVAHQEFAHQRGLAGTRRRGDDEQTAFHVVETVTSDR